MNVQKQAINSFCNWRDSYIIFCFIMSLSNLRDEPLIGHIYIYWEAAQLSVFSELSSERNSINLPKGERREAHNDFRKNERAQCGKTHGKKKRWWEIGCSSSQQRSSSDTNLHFGFHILVLVTLLDMDGGIFKTRGFSLLRSLAPYTITPTLALPTPFFLPLSLHPFLLSISSSSSSQRSSLRKKMSYTVYESTFTWLAKLEQVHLISLSLWLHSCHANPNILSVLS